jgi:hypothetical protein
MPTLPDKTSPDKLSWTKLHQTKLHWTKHKQMQTLPDKTLPDKTSPDKTQGWLPFGIVAFRGDYNFFKHLVAFRGWFVCNTAKRNHPKMQP